MCVGLKCLVVGDGGGLGRRIRARLVPRLRPRGSVLRRWCPWGLPSAEGMGDYLIPPFVFPPLRDERSCWPAFAIYGCPCEGEHEVLGAIGLGAEFRGGVWRG